MHAWEAIQNSLIYIEEHLRDEIKIDTLSRTAALSPYYYQRLFCRLVRKPVSEYIRLRRLAKASEALLNKGKRILDVALEYQFSNHGNFTRAFREAYGITPDKYRNSGVILNHFIMPDLSISYNDCRNPDTYVSKDIVLEVSLRSLVEPLLFLGMEREIPVTEFTQGKDTGVATTGILWEDFHKSKSEVPNLVPQGNEIGVLYLGDARPGYCYYLAGAQVYESTTSSTYVPFTLPKGEYVICGIEAESFEDLVGSALYKAITFMGHWLSKKKLRCDNLSVEMYYPSASDNYFMEIWMPIKE